MKDGNKITERHVQAIWYDRDLRPNKLFTTDGQIVRVVHPGEWNGTSGPDFRGAVMEVGTERRRIVGDVEIHLSPSDWDLHRHGEDPAYRNVVAHVTWRNGVSPATLPRDVLSIWLGRYLSSDMHFSPEGIDLEAYPFARQPIDERPCRREQRNDPERIRHLLSWAGIWRLRVKAERMAASLKVENAKQVFYSEVMNALGYTKNADSFRAVATAVPYVAIQAEPENAERAFQAAATFIEWNRDRIRPNNVPEVRLASAAHLFTETDVMSLTDIRDMSPSACRHMLTILMEGRHVGRGRAAAILSNVVIPFALAQRHVRDLPEWLPPEDVSEPVRRLAYRMFGSDHNPRVWYATNGLIIQGLIQIDREWCTQLHPECRGCKAIAA